MAVRLSVIMVQSRAPGAGAQRMADELVGTLIGAEGIDLALIGPLADLAETATDRLTLETLSGDVAVLDWQGPQEIVLGLTSVNFLADRARHPHDGDAPQSGQVGRRVFAFDMNRFQNAAELVTALRELNQRRQVRTFSIGLGGQLASEGSGASHAAPTQPSAQAHSGTPTAASEAQTSSSGGRTMAAEPGRQALPPRLDLDDLLEQLDRADP